jgi:hypothetical protein
VTKRLVRCEHSAMMPCHQEPVKYICREVCGGTMSCCTRTCKSQCSECQLLSKPAGDDGKKLIQRSKHKVHSCERTLYCQHLCGLDCHPKEKGCNPTCKQQCRQRCTHHKCNKPCSTPCAPCMQPCEWKCSHYSCPVSCGSVCLTHNLIHFYINLNML